MESTILRQMMITELRQLEDVPSDVLWNSEAFMVFPEAKVVNLPLLCYDHNPILFRSQMTNPPKREARPFRFEAAWLSHENFDAVFKGAWMQHFPS